MTKRLWGFFRSLFSLRVFSPHFYNQSDRLKPVLLNPLEIGGTVKIAERVFCHL
jgi:RNase P/RNase MRP subunit POP5